MPNLCIQYEVFPACIVTYQYRIYQGKPAVHFSGVDTVGCSVAWIDYYKGSTTYLPESDLLFSESRWDQTREEKDALICFDPNKIMEQKNKIET